MPFFLRQKVQILSKILPQFPKFANFVKFHQKINIFVTSASFRDFISFSSKTKFFGAYKSSVLLPAELQTFALII